MSYISFIFQIIILLFSNSESTVPLNENYPVPKKNEKFQFYIQRNHNKNTIVYELQTASNGNINIDEPIKVYWIRYEEQSQIQNLSYIQRKFAYGVDAELIDKQNETFKMNLVCFKARDLILKKVGKENKYKTFMKINDKIAILERIFVQAKNRKIGFPKVLYVELFGSDPMTGKPIYEKFSPEN